MMLWRGFTCSPVRGDVVVVMWLFAGVYDRPWQAGSYDTSYQVYSGVRRHVLCARRSVQSTLFIISLSLSLGPALTQLSLISLGKKVKEVDLYSAFIVVPHT